MNRFVSSTPLSARRLRSAASLLLVFMLGLTTPFAGLVRAQGAAETVVARKKPTSYAVGPRSTYIIYNNDGDVACRDATPAEAAAIESGGKDVGLRQINHLEDLPVAAPTMDDGTPNSATGLTIILRGTSQLEANPVAKQAFVNAAAKWEAIITSPITIVIDVDYGPTHFGTPFSSDNILGATSTQNLFGTNNYGGVRSRLIAQASSPEESALYNALPTSGLPTDIGTVNTLLVASPILRALGVINPVADPTAEKQQFGDPPQIGFNSKFSFDFNPDDGITRTQTDFDAVAVHEIGHALGFDSEVGARELQPTRQLLASMWDMFRFRPGTAASQSAFTTAPRILSSGGEHVEVNDFPDTELRLSTGKPDGSGGDGEQSSHWKDDFQNSGIFIGIMDPNISAGRREVLTENDRRAIDRMGYRTVGAIVIPPPVNDNFGNAKVITAATGTDSINTVSATREPGEPNHVGFFGGKSAWYRWTATTNGTATFDTLNSGFDTMLAVYTGNTVGALNAITGNDDITQGQIVASRVQFNAVAGTTYFIALDGFNDTFEDPIPNPQAADSGIAILNWSLPVGAPPPAPANNNIANAIVLSGNAGSVSGTNVGATKETGEPSHSPDGNAGGASVWYRLNSPGNGQLTVNTSGSNFNTLLGVYAANNTGALGVANLLRVAKNNDASADATSSVTFNAVAGLVYYIAVDGANGATGSTLTLNWNFAGSASVPTVQFSHSNFDLPESGGAAAVVTVTRTGDLSAAATVDMSTGVPPFQADCGVGNGGAANPRCDYANFGGTIRFAPGVDSRNVFIPIVDDTYLEGNETIAVTLSNARGASLGAVSTANVSILDNDAASTTSPIDQTAFFVKQQYYDFLSREPDGTGFAGWQATIQGCPGGGFGNANPGCDRVHVSKSFYQSDEFQGRGYFAYRFYQVAFGRRPTFAEFIPDIIKVGGPQSPADEAASKAEFTEAFTLRPEFTAKYNQPQFQSSQAYVNELERTAQVTLDAAFKASLVAALDNGTKTRDVVLRDIAETGIVQNRYFNEAFVAMQYFGYQRRDPDQASFLILVGQLNQDPQALRKMIFDFIFSDEYRVRFGLR
ncbi:MAG TPA: NF038122 family metalloprotease [Pyrinomonadaceae bacterium]|nr:NF038122 family metalloprotease [Pyrinomonadaceae bacterium]